MDDKNILIVDDERSIQKSLRRSFFDFPYIIFTASSGLEALEILKSNKMDLVISDYKMPGMDGAELLKSIKENYPGILRILISGYIDKNKLMESLFQFNVVSLLPKPWDEEILHKRVKKYFDLQDLVNDDNLWKKLNNHKLISMFNCDCEEMGSLFEYIICEPAIFSGLLHLYNSDYYNGGKQLDIKIIEKHFTSQSIEELIDGSRDNTVTHPFGCFSQKYSQSLNLLYKSLKEKLSVGDDEFELPHPSLVNLFRFITFICTEELFNKRNSEHFFLKIRNESIEFNEDMKQISINIKYFLTLWDIADPLLILINAILKSLNEEGFGQLKKQFKLLFIVDFFLELDAPSNKGLIELEEYLLTHPSLQQL